MVFLRIFLLAVAIPAGYILFIILKLLVTSIRTLNKFPDIDRPFKLTSFPYLDQFTEDGVKRLLHAHVSPQGDILHPVSNLGPHLDGKPTIMVSEAEEFAQLLKIEKFPKLGFVYETMELLVGNGLVTSNGELWKRQRRNLTPLFHFKSLSHMPLIMNKRIQQFGDELAAYEGKPIAPIHEFNRLTLRIVIDCVFGGSEFLDADVLSPLWESAIGPLTGYFITCAIFGKQFNDLLPLPHNISLRRTMKKIRGLVKEAIDKKKLRLMNGEQPSGDLLESLLLVCDETTGETIPESLIIDEALTFLAAGHDTTSALLSWAMTFLSRDASIVNKIREEVENVIGDRVPEYADVQHLHYCSMVLRECLRMRPPVHTLDRVALEDFEVVGKKFPAKTYVYPLIIAAHYDNRYWKDPWTFNPYRFDASNKENPARSAYAFIPFSASSRNCIGQKFAMMEAVLALASIVMRFDIVSHTKPEDDKWHIQGTMKPVGFKCSFHKRIFMQ